jgi:hypothetical protein
MSMELILPGSSWYRVTPIQNSRKRKILSTQKNRPLVFPYVRSCNYFADKFHNIR